MNNDPSSQLSSLPLPTEAELFEALERCVPSHLNGTRVTKYNLALDTPFFVHHLGGKPGPTDEVWTVRADASFFPLPPFGKVGTVAWQVRRPGRDYKIKVLSRRRFDGASNMVEIIGACCGLKEALHHGARHAVLVTDNQNVVKYLADVWHTDADSYARPHRDRLEGLAAQFDSLQLVWVRTKPTLKDLDNAARKAARAECKRIKDSWEGYSASLDTKMKEPVKRSVLGSTGILCYDGYTATVNPPYCSCYCWASSTSRALSHNPRNRPKRVCKHLAAAYADAGATGERMAAHLRDYHLALRRGQEPPKFIRPEASAE